ncbi:cytochrome P450 [Aspergillus karnatakaensis]|uniref:cytochrome P450 n=1 Tax=Aspergillus karnatakaensis TaxID=1810916 RepID=UPI003CCDF870
MPLLWIAVQSLGVPIILLATYIVFNEVLRWSKRIKGLKGPRGLPLIGNLRDVNKQFSAEQYRQWSEEYGPVYQVQLGNSPVVLVNNAEEAKTLFLNQSSSLISRPLFHVFHKTVSKNVASIGTSPWNESCKQRRKVAGGALNRPKVQSYEPIILRETSDFISALNAESRNGTADANFNSAVHRLSLNMVMTLNYGMRIAKTTDLKEDAFYAEVVEVENQISKLRSTSRNLANYIPLLQFLEPIFWRETAAKAADVGNRRIAYNNELLRRLQSAVDKDEDVPCIQGNVLRDPEGVALSNNELLSISLSMMAGADSSQPTINWAFLLLAHNPAIQQTAYEELQKVTGSTYSLSETKDVEYIYALVKEVLRFYTPLPLSMPRETTAPVQYKDTVIPTGTMVFLNAYACNHDPALFPSPWTFNPTRWLEDSSKHTHQFAFGYGSRMCVATHLATRLVYTVLYHTLANFEIQPASDAQSWEWDAIKGLKDPTALNASPAATRARFVKREMRVSD